MTSYPPPAKPLNPPSINPRPRLAPLGVAPSMVSFDADSIPPPHLRAFDSCTTHVSTLHFTPAAFPRCPSTPGRIEIPDNLPSPERKAEIKKTAIALIREKRQLERELLQGKLGDQWVQENVGLWNAVLRIRRKRVEGERLDEGVKRVTMVVTHPNGLHKETWEVPFRGLIDLTERPDSPVRVEDIWLLECVDHGDSALANGGRQPRLADRSDYGRDIANFLIHYLPVDDGRVVPQRLTRVDEKLAQRRIQSGLEGKGNRALLGVGHSLGGDAMVHAALSYPNLFQALAISETTLFPRISNNDEAGFVYVGGALGRRASWSSRDEARNGLVKAPMYAAMHPEVLESFINHAIYDDRVNGGVRLKCGPESEARQFNELLSMSEAWELLPTLDERIALHWIMGGLENSSDIVGGSVIAQNTVWRRSKNTTNVRIPGGGHLVVQERPMEYAKELYDFLARTFRSGARTKL